MKTKEDRVPAVHAKGRPFGQYRELTEIVKRACEIAGKPVDHHIFFRVENGLGVTVESLFMGYLLCWTIFSFRFADGVGEFPDLLRREICIIITVIHRVVDLSHFGLDLPMHVLIGYRFDVGHVIGRDADGLWKDIPK